jgi:putative phosphoesterase
MLHAGDIGADDILDRLAEIAPLIAVRGNNDRSGRARALTATALERCGDVGVFLIHDLAQLAAEPAAAGARVVVSGHSHKPVVNERNGVLYVNPGSAGPRRFKLPISVGELLIDGTNIVARLQTL